MKTAIIVHGMPGKEEYLDKNNPLASHNHWFPWMQRELTLSGTLTQAPEMPTPYEPDYETWSKVFSQFTVNEDTTLIGHSCGAGFLVRYLSEHKIHVGKVILVAPWLDPKGELASKMFVFTMDGHLRERCKEVVVVYSTDDDEEVLASVSLLKAGLEGVTYKVFTDRGHFTYGEMKTNRFPELLELVLA